MGYTRIFAAGIAAMSLLAGAPAAAETELEKAQKLRELDIMLMVTSLRCRFGADDFQPDYQAFSARHLSTLNAAARRLTTTLAAQHGTRGANRALDRLSTRMANAYGMGHPRLGCAELKQVTRQLTQQQSSTLVAAADELLGQAPRESVLAMAR
jgi:hypothetical protein